MHLLRCSLLLAAAACGSSTTPRAPAAVAATPTLEDIEAALAGAHVWRVEATIHATGALSADVTASVLAARDNRVRIDATGTFQGQPLAVRWVSDGARTTTGAATPPSTTEAVIIGLTRMGLLHNVARLASGGAAPDHADGGAREWLMATDPHELAAGQLAFGLKVDGEPAADVTLGVAAGPHGPVMTSRHIVVMFDDGDMTVDERYTFDLAVTLPSIEFVVGDGP